jgi:hypothetical protein
VKGEVENSRRCGNIRKNFGAWRQKRRCPGMGRMEQGENIIEKSIQ